MNVLLTGGSGFIGSNLVRLLLTERPDWRIVNLDKLTYAGNAENLADLEGNPRYRFVRGDICNGELVADIFRTEKIDAAGAWCGSRWGCRSAWWCGCGRARTPAVSTSPAT